MKQIKKNKKFRYGVIWNQNPKLEITTMIGCPLMCTFCPQTELRTKYGVNSDKYLSLENFKKAIKKLPAETEIYFSGMSEPFANNDCIHMIEHALEMGHKVLIATTLYGISLDQAMLIKNYTAKYPNQFLEIRLHLPDASGNMKGWKDSAEWRAVYKIISELNVPCGINQMTMDGSGRPHESISELVKGKMPNFTGHSRADSLDTSSIEPNEIEVTPNHTAPVMCGWQPNLDYNVMLPNGDIVLCCMDYSLKHIIGNLFESEYQEILSSENLKKVFSQNETKGFTACTICKSCTVAEPLISIGSASLANPIKHKGNYLRTYLTFFDRKD